MTSNNADLLLRRLLQLKEPSPVYLVVDSLAQSSQALVEEIMHNNPKVPIAYLLYETISRPEYATTWIECLGRSVESVISSVKLELSSGGGNSVINVNNGISTKSLVIVDSLNYVSNSQLTQLIQGLMVSPSTVVVGVYHSDVPETRDARFHGYPSSMQLLHFMATTIFTLEPVLDELQEETVANETARMYLSSASALNNSRFRVSVANRRKSGRSIGYDFVMDSKTHTAELVKEEQAPLEEDESLLRDLTTFNLITSSKQKLAREQVELPYMEAQESLGSMGGAIVYEFEKDDDYDEEDPYEDPF